MELISRQAAIDAKQEFRNPNIVRDSLARTAFERTYANGWNDCNSAWIDAINTLPSAEPELRWRPVSENRNFPKYKNLYCYCWDKKTGGNWAEVLYRSEDGFWCKPTGDVFNYEVLAWYPLPGKAYRERKEEK